MHKAHAPVLQGAAGKRGTSRRAIRALAGGFLTLACLILTSSTASAGGGSAAVDQYIVANPVPGWTQASSAGVDFMLALAESIESRHTHESLSIGAEIWDAPSGQGALTIVLGVFPHSVPTAAIQGGSPSADVAAECGSSSTAAPSSVPNIAGSAIETCPAGGQPGGATTTYVIWTEGNVLATVQGSGLSPLAVIMIAQHEAAKIPSSGISLVGGMSTLEIGAIAAGGLVVIIAVVVLVVRRRRSRETGLPAPAIVAPHGTAGAQDWDWGPTSPTTATTAAPIAQAVPLAPVVPEPLSYLAAEGDAAGAEWKPYSPPRSGFVDVDVMAERAPSAQGEEPASVSSARLPSVEEAEPASGGEQSAPADWYPIDENPYLLRYWDGTAWTARRRWDGSDWVDDPEEWA